ncbi:MAG: hypothetical protein H7A37_00070 [Chlamydiales bacterium]|nr:hypothetical protein [Chlamydiia bacterium]MCP5506689.1 hypothetical protein [Chlamydiales bacterium]
MSNKIIHIAEVCDSPEGKQYLFLREETNKEYRWYRESNANGEVATDVSAETVEEALRLARKQWHRHSYRTVICGFRYTLPERDEHGNNALYHQMAASLSTLNGIYFDEELGHNCYVQNASLEARKLWERLK